MLSLPKKVPNKGASSRTPRFTSFHSSSQSHNHGPEHEKGETPLFPGWWSFYFSSSFLFLWCLHFCPRYLRGSLRFVRVGEIGEGIGSQPCCCSKTIVISIHYYNRLFMLCDLQSEDLVITLGKYLNPDKRGTKFFLRRFVHGVTKMKLMQFFKTFSPLLRNKSILLMIK